MKGQSLILLLLLFKAFTSAAQESFNIEISAGYNVSTMSVKMNDTKLKSDFKSGFNIGILVTEMNLMKEGSKAQLSLETGFLFTSTGTGYSASGTVYDSIQTTHTYDLSRTTRIYNVSLPLVVKQIFGYKRVRFYADYGCYLSLKGQANNKSSITHTEVSISGPTTSYSYEEEAKVEFDDLEWWDRRNYDFGLYMGVGIKIKNRLRIGLHYTHGFGNLATDALIKANEQYGLFNTSYKNRVLMLSVGFNVIKKTEN